MKIYTFILSACLLLVCSACHEASHYLLLGGSGWDKIAIVNKNTKEIESQAIIDIYDKIAKSKIKNIFVAMAFSEANCNNVWDAISTVYDELIRQDGLQLDMTKIDSAKYILNRVDKGLDVSKDIIFAIKDGIANSQLVIVDLSYQKQNGNRES
jgi:ABC-type Zn uptake system ZnuABC Zn-binding protein ZnuA